MTDELLARVEAALEDVLNRVGRSGARERDWNKELCDLLADVRAAKEFEAAQETLKNRAERSCSGEIVSAPSSNILLEVERIEALREKATPGPWYVDDWTTDDGPSKTTIEARELEILHPGQSNIWPNGVAKKRIAETEEGECPIEDAALIVALRNAFPALADAVRQGERMRTAAERVVWFDWSNNDSDAVYAIEKLRQALAEEGRRNDMTPDEAAHGKIHQPAAPAQPRHFEFTKWFLAWRKSIRAPDDGSTDEARSCAWKVWGLKERELAAMTALQHATHADFETISNQLAAANARADDAEVALKETGEALARTDTLLLMERTAREKAIIFVGELRADKTELSGMLHDNQVGSNELGKQLAAAEYRLATIAAETIERCAKVCYADAEKCASQPGSMRERNEALFLMHAIRALSTKEKRG